MAKLQDPEAMLSEAVDTMMKVIDKDGNGLCSKEEFKAFVQEKGETPLKDEEVDELFNAVDTDGDKTTLTRDELLTVLKIGLQANQQSRQS
ncbi:calmodulin-like protein 3 [Ruditapes philippinarum]|uniref:calmodulin-like protein 3 n=1 Tax=Ruditapes philippinarum TaxID=129788 RepID=UPI00295AC294|nr:calmodulin-like protein 3 [Ruditapes philippinarum]